MPKTKKVGKDASQTTGEAYYRTFQKLLRQKEQVDHQILKVQRQFFRCLIGKSNNIGKKNYVTRMHNTVILRDAIRKCMVPGKEMTTQDVISSLKQRGIYLTNSDYFYTMVNNKLNKLNRDKKIQKTSRGVFILRKSGQMRSRKKLVSTAA